MLSVSNNVTNSFIPLEIPVRRRSLIELPENYLSLLSKADQFKCPNSVSKESKSPALCLACGTIVCSQVKWFVIQKCYFSNIIQNIRLNCSLTLFYCNFRVPVASYNWIGLRPEVVRYMLVVVVEIMASSWD